MKRSAPVVAWLLGAMMALPYALTIFGGGFNYESAGIGVALLAMGLLGALIIGRQPGNRMGWVFASVGLLGGIAGFAEVWESEALAHLAGGFAWFLLFYTVVVLIPLLFPTGRVAGSGWRWVFWVSSAAIVTHSLLWIFQDQVCLDLSDGVCVESVDNPIGLTGVENPELSGIGNAGLSIVLLGGLASLVSLFVRFRRAQELERLQIKWLLWAIALFIGSVVLIDIVLVEQLGFQPADVVYSVLYGFIWLTIPVAAGIAIFRYRLFEIDRLVSRTVTYSLIVALLAAVYFAVVGLFTQILRFESDLGVAAATLAAAAVFSPLRRRLRNVVDRRFNRTRYDAGLIVDRLSQRLKDATDAADVVLVSRWAVDHTVRPATFSVWLNERRGPG
ncbi:MAG: hypothetical protein ACT4OP_13190 [Actinomycetota bacterium]